MLSATSSLITMILTEMIPAWLECECIIYLMAGIIFSVIVSVFIRFAKNGI